MTSVSLHNLSIGYTTKGVAREVFPPISAEAHAGELVSLIGRNGQGKSTLLRTIIGFQPALAGEVSIFEKRIADYDLRTLATLVSYVSTDNVKVGNLKVFDLVSLGRYPYTGWFGTLSQADREEVMRSLHMVGMGDYAWRNTNRLSDGERQRVMIARALAQGTPIIVLDEPTAFLDLPNKYDIVLLLKKLAREQQKTILFSTHDLSIALKVSDRMWVMYDGEMRQGAPPRLMADGVFDRLLKNTQLSVDHVTGEVHLSNGGLG